MLFFYKLKNPEKHIYMNLLRNITKYVYQFGDEDNNYTLPLADVILENYSKGDINLFIKDKKLYLLTYTNYTYAVSSLTNFEKFSILYSIEQQYDNVLN